MVWVVKIIQILMNEKYCFFHNAKLTIVLSVLQSSNPIFKEMTSHPWEMHDMHISSDTNLNKLVKNASIMNAY